MSQCKFKREKKKKQIDFKAGLRSGLELACLLYRNKARPNEYIVIFFSFLCTFYRNGTSDFTRCSISTFRYHSRTLRDSFSIGLKNKWIPLTNLFLDKEARGIRKKRKKQKMALQGFLGGQHAFTLLANGFAKRAASHETLCLYCCYLHQKEA